MEQWHCLGIVAVFYDSPPSITSPCPYVGRTTKWAEIVTWSRPTDQHLCPWPGQHCELNSMSVDARSMGMHSLAGTGCIQTAHSWRSRDENMLFHKPSGDVHAAHPISSLRPIFVAVGTAPVRYLQQLLRCLAYRPESMLAFSGMSIGLRLCKEVVRLT